MKDKKQLVALAKEYIKTPRGAFIAGVILGTFLGKSVLTFIF